MFTSSIKRLHWSLGLLLLFAPNFSAAQSEDDSTFNGIDYYAGRIVRGFGGGFEQLVYEKKEGVQSFLTTPFVYGGLGNRFSLRLSNMTYWTRFENDFPGRSDREKFRHVPKVEATYRPVAGLLIGGDGTFTKETWNGPQNTKSEFAHQAYTFHELYLSQNGGIELTRDQLGWVYYAEPFAWSLQNTLEYPIRFLSMERALKFLSPGQYMLSVSGNFLNSRSTTQFNDTENDDFRSNRFTSRFLDLDFAYTLKRRLAIGFSLQPSRNKSEGYGRTPKTEFQSIFKSTIVSSAPRVDYLGPWHTLHRFAAEYADGKTSSESEDQAMESRSAYAKSKDERRNLGYTLHYLWKVEPTSQEALLADWNGTFGNRLPAHALHLIGRAITSFSKNKREEWDSSRSPYYQWYSQESRHHTASLTGIYGVSDWLELGGKAEYFKLRYQSAWFYRPAPVTGESSFWRSALSLSCANYRYEERFKERFGWEQIREFDRLYGPLLLGGMINGTLGIELNINESGDRSRIGLVVTQIRWGITDNLELNFLGRISIRSFPDYFDINRRRKVLTRKDFDFSLSWQPWESIRFQIGQGPFEQTTRFRDIHSGPVDRFWSFQIVSLF